MYQTLYRKYRPKNFDEVVGQDVVVKTLKNSIKNNKINHAYMFFGPRGVGKTSIAKIFAKTINCSKQDGNICGECEACIASSNKECLDIIEIDAASNNGVDEIRELRDKVNLVPNELKYKVYIIDEVHMLTIQAFNALLKTLEEPPSHVIFIFATTDPQKVPETIISRCQCFSFDRISNSNIVVNLRKIADLESIKVDDDVLLKIAEFSNGGMRDSIGMLDKLFAYAGDTITMDDFIALNKIISRDEILNFIKYVDSDDMENVISEIDRWNANGNNIIQLMDSILDCLKDIIIESLKGNSSTISDVNKIIKLANLVNEKMFDLKKCNNPKIYIEILFLNFINQYNEVDVEVVPKKVSKIISREIISKEKEENVGQVIQEDIKTSVEIRNQEEKVVDKNIEVKAVINENVETLENSNILDIIGARINNAFAEADKNELLNDKKLFEKLNDFVFDQDIGYLACSLMDSKLRVSSKKVLVLSYEYDSIVKENLKNLDNFSNVLKDKIGIDKKVAIVSDEEWEKEKTRYIEKIKNNDKYTYVDEPELVYNSIDTSSDTIDDDSIGVFGDIVEIE